MVFWGVCPRTGSGLEKGREPSPERPRGCFVQRFPTPFPVTGPFSSHAAHCASTYRATTQKGSSLSTGNVYSDPGQCGPDPHIPGAPADARGRTTPRALSSNCRAMAFTFDWPNCHGRPGLRTGDAHESGSRLPTNRALAILLRSRAGRRATGVRRTGRLRQMSKGGASQSAGLKPRRGGLRR